MEKKNIDLVTRRIASRAGKKIKGKGGEIIQGYGIIYTPVSLEHEYCLEIIFLLYAQIESSLTHISPFCLTNLVCLSVHTGHSTTQCPIGIDHCYLSLQTSQGVFLVTAKTAFLPVKRNHSANTYSLISTVLRGSERSGRASP